jgi:hypothetical protein
LNDENKEEMAEVTTPKSRNKEEMAEVTTPKSRNKEEMAESYFKKYTENKFKISLYYEDIDKFSKELGTRWRGKSKSK